MSVKTTVIDIPVELTVNPIISSDYVREEALGVAKGLAREMVRREALGLHPVTKSEALRELRKIPGVMDVSVVDPEAE